MMWAALSASARVRKTISSPSTLHDLLESLAICADQVGAGADAFRDQTRNDCLAHARRTLRLLVVLERLTNEAE